MTPAKKLPRRFFARLHALTETELEAEGLSRWAASKDGPELWLFPAWMYDRIPDGTPVCTILGELLAFKHDTTSNDHRAGFLAFGVLHHQWESPRERALRVSQ